jgi:cytosine/adenosine deaminase-related metal-dependent hydrolase
VIVTADWVVPVASRPIRDGAVLTRTGSVEAVGRLDDLRAAAPGDDVERFDGCVITPGLVNARTRLSLHALHALLPAGDPTAFADAVDRAVGFMDDDDLAASASLGAVEALRCGVTSVGDVCYGPEALAACADVGVGGVFFWEVRGIDADELAGELAESEYPAEAGRCSAGRGRCGLTPRGVSGAGPGLIQAAWQVAARHGVAFMIEVAESKHERQLLVNGTGPLARRASRLAAGFRAPGKAGVGYLDGLGVLAGATVVHCVHLEDGDPKVLKRATRGVVVCPRSNAAMKSGAPPVARLCSAGVKVAIGTDTPAGPDLDVLEDARVVQTLDPTLTARGLLHMVTKGAAEVLGIGDAAGSLAPGRPADLAIFTTGAVSDPESAIVRSGGGGTVRAVLSGGLWRVRDGKSAFPATTIERAAAATREKVERELAASSGS